MKLDDVLLTENISVGNTISVKQFDAGTNRRTKVDAKIEDVIKKPDGSQYVVYQVKGKGSKKVAMNVFKNLMK